MPQVMFPVIVMLRVVLYVLVVVIMGLSVCFVCALPLFLCSYVSVAYAKQLISSCDVVAN